MEEVKDESRIKTEYASDTIESTEDSDTTKCYEKQKIQRIMSSTSSCGGSNLVDRIKKEIPIEEWDQCDMIDVDDLMTEVKMERADLENHDMDTLDPITGAFIPNSDNTLKDDVLNRLKTENIKTEKLGESEMVPGGDSIETYPVQLTEELDIKNETDGFSDVALESVAEKEAVDQESQSSVAEKEAAALRPLSRYHCEYTTKQKVDLVKNKIYKPDLDQNVVKNDPDLIASVTRDCNSVGFSDYEFDKRNLIRLEYKCTHCNESFSCSSLLKKHTVLKHPKRISNKIIIYKCPHCPYATAMKSKFLEHKLNHTKTNSESVTYLHCNKRFVNKTSLEEHIIKEHRFLNTSSSISEKALECTMCAFKTNISREFLDYHILKSHPDIISSIISQIYQCKHCSYKTTLKSMLDAHELDHVMPSVTSKSSYECMYCSRKNLNEVELNDHILKYHPDSFSKIYMCKHCCEKFSNKAEYDDHFLKNHLNWIIGFKELKCTMPTFKTEMSKEYNLDNHTLKSHPDMISSITSKIYECRHCSYKTTMKSRLDDHELKHVTPNSTYKCKYCSRKNFNEVELNDHILKYHPDFFSRIYMCEHCCEKFSNKAEYDYHVIKNHPHWLIRFKELKCTMCTFKTGMSKAYLDNHILKSHPDISSSITSKIYHCKQCSYKSTIKSVVNKHELGHTTANSEPITCVMCKQKFMKIKMLHEHIIAKHPDLTPSSVDKIYECDTCHKSFTRKTALHQHILRNHADMIPSVTSKIHECNACDYKTIRKYHLSIHVSNHHNPMPTFSCIMCSFKTEIGREFLENHILKYHPDLISTITSQIYECKHCSYKTTMKSMLDDHELKHVTPDFFSRIYMCKHCCEKFSNKSEYHDHGCKELKCTICTFKTRKSKEFLDNHILKSHPDMISSITSKIYECRHCSYKTTTIGLLDKHELQHAEMNLEIVTCVVCKKKYLNKNLLCKHIIAEHPHFTSSHSDKIYECDTCHKSYTNKTHLHNHIIRIHTEMINSIHFRVN